ncbi:zona pellucida sperm-binding protein 3 [Pagrus major]|uniref:zona pellucida sperm-binding protein 3 n=1 Tax=Pagrus major TaxID=143350 RepID=UPI003CC882F3
MKTKWHLYIFWSVLSLGLLSCAVDTYESQFTRRKKLFKPGTPKSTLSTTRNRKASLWLPASSSLLSQLGPTPAPGTPRSMRQGEIQSGFAYLPDVSVTCSTSDFIVRVKPAFYGQGADAEELKLGNTCKSNGVLGPYGDLLFTYPLTACDAVRQTPRGYLVYKFVLHFEPSPKRFPSRAQRIDVDIECRYQRNHHVYQLTVQPTWETAVVRKRLKGSLQEFQIELMDDSWSRPAKSQMFQLGKKLNFQISAAHLPTGGKLYVNSCYASPSTGSESPLKYTILDNFGCMLDSKREPGASRFISRTDKTLRFSLKAFQFTSDPDTEVSIHCKLFVTSEEPGPAHKSCTYRGNRWKALTGDDSICECCDSQCVTSKPRRAMIEGSASSGSLLVSDQPYTADDGFLPVGPSSISMSRDGEATVSHYTDELRGHENLWGSEDVVIYDEDEEEQEDTDDEEEEEEEEEEEQSGVIVRVITEPHLEELGFRQGILAEEKNESELKASSPFEEDWSGYLAEEDFLVGEEEDDEIADAQQVIHLNQREGKDSLQRELQRLVSEGEEENREHTGRGEEDRMIASEVEQENDDEDVVYDREMTWYFTWR